jgi:hypothetical protein
MAFQSRLWKCRKNAWLRTFDVAFCCTGLVQRQSEGQRRSRSRANNARWARLVVVLLAAHVASGNDSVLTAAGLGVPCGFESSPAVQSLAVALLARRPRQIDRCRTIRKLGRTTPCFRRADATSASARSQRNARLPDTLQNRYVKACECASVSFFCEAISTLLEQDL